MMLPTTTRSLARQAMRNASSAASLQRVAGVRCLSSSTARSMVTKEERWTHETADKASQLLASGGPNGAALDVKQVLPNIEARWKEMPKEEQYAVFRQLEEIQKKDWKELSLDEKKAAYFISFGPHGPRKPVTVPGQAIKTFSGVMIGIVVTAVVFYGVRHAFANPESPKTFTTEYQEAMTERAREEKQNPITGITSEGYKGSGHVQKSYA